MKPTKIILYIVTAGLLTAIFMIAWFKRGFFESGYELPDVTKIETIKIQKSPRQGYIHYLRIEGWGEVDGEAEIDLMQVGKPYRTEKLAGSVNFRWDTEWYGDSAEIHYKPTSVKNGTIKLRYRFKD